MTTKQVYLLIVILCFSYTKINAQCNGLLSLCNKNYDKVAYLTSHNAFNSDEDNFLLPNQNFNITSQLNAGVRALMIDVYDVNGTPTVYHGFSALGSAPFLNYLTEIKSFLDNNPNEIVTIILECYTTAIQIENEINLSGLNNDLYTHDNNNWPTLQDMINTGTRFVVFSDQDDASSLQGWYHYLWDYAVETHYTSNSLSDFNCDFNRGDSTNSLFILNHFITDSTLGIGIESEAIIANSNPFFINRALQCYQEKTKFPNFITVDFYEKGNGLDVVNELNQISPTLNVKGNYYSKKLFIYPNPSNDFIQVLELQKKENYIIYNSLMHKICIGSISNNERIDIKNLTNGLYFLKLETGKFLKFIKE